MGFPLTVILKRGRAEQTNFLAHDACAPMPHRYRMARCSLPVGALQSMKPSGQLLAPVRGLLSAAWYLASGELISLVKECLAAGLWSTTVELVKSRTRIGIITMDVRRSW